MHAAPPAVSSPRTRFVTAAAAAAAAAAVGAVIVFAPSASASDAFGFGYAIPIASHLGAYGPPGAVVPGINGLSYCADPGQVGPTASAGYGPATSYDTWSTAAGKQVSRSDVADAAYILAEYGQTTADVQAAAVDAAVTSLLNPGTTYALPDGGRAVERVSYPNVPPTVKTRAMSYMSTAARLAGPYTVHIVPQQQLRPGKETPLIFSVTSAEGYRVPGIQLHVTAISGANSAAETLTTRSDGTAAGTVSLPPGEDEITLTAVAAALPSDTLRAVVPHNALAQRMLLTGGTSSAQTKVVLRSTAGAGGRIEILKQASDTHKPLAGVQFAIRDSKGTTVATGKTNADGTWQTPLLPPGRYFVHESRAVNGYNVAADQTVTVATGKVAMTTVTDSRIPQPSTPAPRPATLPSGVLPQTGA